ncbi:hypothetical protein F5Y11DRAFT_344507 [Daldinia sp. FL1419]|nr:hypothetical protein F5Y11DRAFT_344507 [Daldinia sp. FL1419]
MCKKWQLKRMSCGDFDEDNNITFCEHYDPVEENCVEYRYYHGAEVIRPYTPGDGVCRKCYARGILDQRWNRTISTTLDERRLLFIAARERLLAYASMIDIKDLYTAQNALTHVYINFGQVLDVPMLLRYLKCDIPDSEADFSGIDLVGSLPTLPTDPQADTQMDFLGLDDQVSDSEVTMEFNPENQEDNIDALEDFSVEGLKTEEGQTPHALAWNDIPLPGQPAETPLLYAPTPVGNQYEYDREYDGIRELVGFLTPPPSPYEE